MSQLDAKKNKEILELAINGNTLLSIGEKYGITKARVGQILSSLNYNTRQVKQEKKDLLLNQLIKSIMIDLEKGLSVPNIRIKYSLSQAEINSLYKKGVNLLIIDSEKIKTRREKAFKMYKTGMTAHEIHTIIGFRSPNDVYKDVLEHKKTTKEKISKNRLNARQERAIKLKKKVKTLKKSRTFIEVLDELKSKGFTNCDGNELRLGTVVYNYYN